MFPPAAVAAGGLNTDSNGDEDDVEVDVVAAAFVDIWKGLKGEADGAEAEGIEVEVVADGIGGIPKRPPVDVENPDCGEDCIGEAPGAAIFRNEE